ncbi:hypothetical protein GCM10010517_71050 [Streptosporangium fragile]|uniref:Uncharacterized protein n=1 Tax=Streptosporangium fragile TaxID=46186 RepID=A0ABN3W7L8_9ACTN
MDRSVARVEIGGALDEDVVVDGRPLRERPSPGRDFLAVAHEVDLGQAQFLAGGEVLRRFAGQSCLPHGVLPDGDPPGPAPRIPRLSESTAVLRTADS